MLKIDSDDFALFDLPRRFTQDRAAIDVRWRKLQAQVHPDRHVAEGAVAQRVAMQWAVRVNEAYQRLKDPLRRAAYLCELEGVPMAAEDNTAMPPEFLMKQMAWRESLDEAADASAVAAIADEVDAKRRETLDRIAHLLDEQHDAPGAAREVRALMFTERFAADVDRRLDALGQ